MAIAFDTETELIRPGLHAPPLVCVTWADTSAPHDSQIIDWRDALAWTRDLLASGETIVGHNLAYDMGVLAAHALSEGVDLNAEIYEAYESERCTDTMIRQWLADIGRGKFRGFFKGPAWIQLNYDLDDVSRRHGWKADKLDPWRLHYGLLREVPLSQWDTFETVVLATYDEDRKFKKGMPEPGSDIVLHGSDAKLYALNDATATALAYAGQAERYEPELLVNEYFQAYKFCTLNLGSTWGLRTSAAGVESLEQGAREHLADLRELLAAHGLVRADGTRDTKNAKAAMIAACAEAEIELRRTKSGDVCLDSDACNATGDPLLEAYAEFSGYLKVLSNDVKAWKKGIHMPIHCRFGMAETGRVTASKPNVQNPRRLAGVRECVVPRANRVYASADYAGLELRTFAQSCLALVGQSEMAKVLNAGQDVHLAMAATILGISYEEAHANKKRKDVDNGRQTSKVANFGFPGGLGAEKLCLFARKSYKVDLSIPEAKQLKKDWLAAWPEARLYFDYVNRLQKSGRPIEHLFTGRLRGGATYTAACNSFFQGLGSDATGAAWCLVSKHCYTRQPCAACDGAASGCAWCRPCHGPGISPLYGSRLVNYIHDEFILECCEDWGHEIAHELERLMVRGAQPYLPDLNVSAEPQLMAYWSKAADAVWKDGRLVVWDGRKKEEKQAA